VEQKENWALDLLKGTNTLFVLDNLETVDDERIFNFVDKLPVPVRVLATSRVQRILRSVYPVMVGSLSEEQSLSLIAQLLSVPAKESLGELNKSERQLIAQRCLRVPLAIEWVIARASSPAEVLELSLELEQYSSSSDVLLEFCFRRIYTALGKRLQSVL